MSGWAAIERVDIDSVSMHLRGNVSYTDGDLVQVPLLVSFGEGDGRVITSSFVVADNDSAELQRVMLYLLGAL